MTDASPRVPAPDEVGQLYDRLVTTALTEGTLGENLHFGYWKDAEESLTLAGATVRLTDLLTDRLCLDGSEHVLDVGCGVGGPALQISGTTGVRVTGISISREQAKQAVRLAEKANLTDRVSFEHANALELPFPEAHFDRAIALESIMHMPNRERVLSEVRRTLRPGGRVVLTDFFAREPIPAAKRHAVDLLLRDFMVTMADINDYIPLLERAGLRFEEITDISEHTVRKTFQALAANRVDRDERTRVFGREAPELFDPNDLVDVHEFGCVLVVARRP